MAFQATQYASPFEMLMQGQKAYQNMQDIIQSSRINPLLVQEKQIANALEEYKKQKMSEESKYYAPIAKAQAEVQQLAPDEHRQKILELQQIMKYRPDLWKSKLAQESASTNRINLLTPLEEEHLKQEIEYKPDIWKSEMDLRKAQIESAKALANQRVNNISGGRYATAAQKELSGFQQQLQKDHPDWSPEMAMNAASAYLEGENQINGQPLPPLSGLSQTMMGIVQKKAGSQVLQNQAALMDELTSELDEIDIEPVKKFTGFAGQAKKGYNATKAAFGLKTSEDYVKYETFKNQAILVMDQLRSALKTSVIPRYVRTTLGELSNPDSTVWNNPELVQAKWDAFVDWSHKKTEGLKTKGSKGFAAPINGEISKQVKNSNDPFGLLS